MHPDLRLNNKALFIFFEKALEFKPDNIPKGKQDNSSNYKN
jgi:hypothetical protein